MFLEVHDGFGRRCKLVLNVLRHLIGLFEYLCIFQVQENLVLELLVHVSNLLLFKSSLLLEFDLMFQCPDALFRIFEEFLLEVIGKSDDSYLHEVGLSIHLKKGKGVRFYGRR